MGEPLLEKRTYVEAAGIRYNGLYSVNCVRIACSSENITVLVSRQVFDERILLRFVLHDAFHFGVRQRSQKLILHKILYNTPRMRFIYIGLSIVEKLYVRCDELKVYRFYINPN